MIDQIQFETPENIQILYKPSGLGTRFVAWFLDSIIMSLLLVVACIGLLCSGIITDSLFRDMTQPTDSRENTIPGQAPQFSVYFLGIIILVWGLGSFFYFCGCELFLRGQTIGKRACGIRVVKADGFSLDRSCILIRNIFRVVDHWPPFWIVPILSRTSQRFGDMTAGTVVVSDKPEELSFLRKELSKQSSEDCKFRFDHKTLQLARPEDFTAIERILDRWNELKEPQQEVLLNQLIPPLVRRLNTESPAESDRLQFLEELLAAEFRRQNRNLG